MKAKPTMFALFFLAASCTGQEWNVSEPPTTQERSEVDETISNIKAADPSIKTFFDQAYGYVVFPDVGTGGLIVGGTHGNGWAYEQGRLIGKASITKVSVGAQAGGENYSEIMFFKDANALNTFKNGKLDLGADAKAVMIKTGAATSAGYNPAGVAVFTQTKGGAMAEASVGGQQFSYEPIGTKK
jgi:lipid-binding SYLF domain-containing protein